MPQKMGPGRGGQQESGFAVFGMLTGAGQIPPDQAGAAAVEAFQPDQVVGGLPSKLLS